MWWLSIRTCSSSLTTWSACDASGNKKYSRHLIISLDSRSGHLLSVMLSLLNIVIHLIDSIHPVPGFGPDFGFTLIFR